MKLPLKLLMATALTTAFMPMTASAKFLSADPVGFAEGGVNHFNHYAYGYNDPINSTDPDGRRPRQIEIPGVGRALHFTFVVQTQNRSNGSPINQNIATSTIQNNIRSMSELVNGADPNAIVTGSIIFSDEKNTGEFVTNVDFGDETTANFDQNSNTIQLPAPPNFMAGDTPAHEMGHAGGLSHVKDSDNLMGARDSQLGPDRDTLTPQQVDEMFEFDGEYNFEN